MRRIVSPQQAPPGGTLIFVLSGILHKTAGPRIYRRRLKPGGLNCMKMFQICMFKLEERHSWKEIFLTASARKYLQLKDLFHLKRSGSLISAQTSFRRLITCEPAIPLTC